MSTAAVVYGHPLVPVEWIVAHGVRPVWLRPAAAGGEGGAGCPRGLCPYAAATIEALARAPAGLRVLTTTCDQMRYAAAAAERHGPVFLLHVPRTGHMAASAFYRAELLRLGRALVAVGGRSPDDAELAGVIRRYAAARRRLRADRARWPAARFALLLADVRGELAETGAMAPRDAPPFADRPALALVGGPLRQGDEVLFDAVEQAGGQIVLDATEGGERTLPPDPDERLLRDDPLGALVEAYFGRIPMVFRRPNDLLYTWLKEELVRRGVVGIVFRRFVWCDLWHAERERLRAWSPVPVLDLDAADEPQAPAGRTLGRLEAFIEMLRSEAWISRAGQQ